MLKNIVQKLEHQNEKEKNQKGAVKNTILSIIFGAIAGLLNGLFGGGGGMVVVPLLTNVLKEEPRIAHATAILIILPMSILSGLLYAVFGNYDFSLGLPVGIGVIVGGVLGAVLLKKLSNYYLTVIFCVVMLIAGAKMLFF